MRFSPSPALLVLPLLVAAGCVPDAAPRDRLLADYLRIVDAEDARPVDGPRLQRLIDGVHDEQPMLRAASVRALGRLEDPTLAPRIEAALDDPLPAVRREAAFALAQAFQGEDGSDALPPLLARLEVEPDATVRGELAQSIGRLGLPEEARHEVLGPLLEATHAESGTDTTDMVELIGALLGIESLLRGADDPAAFAPRLAARVEALTAYQGPPSVSFLAPEPIRVRAMAYGILGMAGAMRTEVLQRALRDNAALVPAVALRYLDQIPVLARPETLRRAVGNPSLFAVIEAFQAIDAGERDALNCRYLFAGARVTPPESPRPVPQPIRVTAIDGLARPCPDLEGQRTLLRDVEATLDDDPNLWQPASHALLAMASVFPGDAAARLSRHAGHDNPFVRTYAARAAELLGNRALLADLASDPHDNVRTAAVQALFALDGHRADDVLLAQLEREDPQLLLTVANLLAGTPRAGEAAPALVDAFDRISDAERETWRDPRIAILQRVGEVGGPSLTDRLLPYLTDYDPLVAESVAGLLTRWNRRPYTPTPAPLPRAPLPSVEDLQAMEGGRIVLHMAGGGAIEIALHPFLATTNVYRFWRLARDGYFDGLTLHRWAPNFVLQGGSPGANEYQGDGPYTRDEVGRLSHWRGTVGISTRGHDTGDGQIFINLMDNPRLDHVYTIVGTVTDGLDVVDDQLEGAVIERAEVVAGH